MHSRQRWELNSLDGNKSKTLTPYTSLPFSTRHKLLTGLRSQSLARAGLAEYVYGPTSTVVERSALLHVLNLVYKRRRERRSDWSSQSRVFELLTCKTRLCASLLYTRSTRLKNQRKPEKIKGKKSWLIRIRWQTYRHTRAKDQRLPVSRVWWIRSGMTEVTELQVDRFKGLKKQRVKTIVLLTFWYFRDKKLVWTWPGCRFRLSGFSAIVKGIAEICEYEITRWDVVLFSPAPKAVNRFN